MEVQLVNYNNERVKKKKITSRVNKDNNKTHLYIFFFKLFLVYWQSCCFVLLFFFPLCGSSIDCTNILHFEFMPSAST